MTENYEIKCIRMTLTNPVKEGIVIGKVVLEDGQKKTGFMRSYAYRKIKRKAGELLSIIGRTVGYPVMNRLRQLKKVTGSQLHLQVC